MIAAGCDALDGFRSVIWPPFPVGSLWVYRSLGTGLARGQDNTLKRAIRVSNIYSAVEPPIGDTLYTSDITGGLRDLVDHVRALELNAGSNARSLRATEGVGVNLAGGGYEQARVINGEMGLQLAVPFGR